MGPRGFLRLGFFDRRRVGRAMGVNGKAMHDFPPLFVEAYLTMRGTSSHGDDTLQLPPPLPLTAAPARPPKMSIETSTLALLVMIALLVWRIHYRLKGMMRRQPSRLWRHQSAALAWPAMIAALAAGAAGQSLALSCLGAGALAGVWLGRWSMRLTRLEATPQGLFFTPNARMAITVAMLFIARLLYHGVELYLDSRASFPAPAQENFAHSPLTLLAFGLLAAYYASHGWYMARWHRHQLALERGPTARE